MQSENTYRPSLPPALKCFPSNPLKFRKTSASKISVISLEGVNPSSHDAQALSIFSSNPERDSNPPSQSLKLNATKGLIGSHHILFPFTVRGFRSCVPHFLPPRNSRWLHVSG